MVGYKTDVGNVRKINEDFLGFLENENFRLYVIADGMGGHNAGDVASKCAVNEIIEQFKNTDFIDEVGNKLVEIVKLANEKVYNYSKLKVEYNGMGTTLTVALIHNNILYVSHVGDSSCFILKNDKINKVTKDHSFVQELIDIGSISEEEAKNHPNRNIITRSLGFFESVDIDIFVQPLEGISKVILCTDGLTNYISNDELYDALLEDNNNDVCEYLVNIAKMRGGRDNISIIVSEGENF